MALITRRYDVRGGSLTLELELDHTLDDVEREALDQLDLACRRYAKRAAPGGRGGEADTAIDELGGEEGLTAA